MSDSITDVTKTLKMVSSARIIRCSKTSSFWGWFFVLSGSLSFLGFVFAASVSKLLPPSDSPVIAAIQKDRYYCFLVPLTLPILVVSVYFHWLSMKLFKHA